MKFLVLAVIAFAAVAQAHRDWSQIKPNELRVTPLRPAPPGSKIVGGQEAKPNQIPHQVALIMNSGSFCGGSLIRADVVLTAAHCVDSASSVEVTAGAHRIQQIEPSQQTIVSRNIIVHENWDPSTLSYDIALVILPTKFNLDDTVQLVNIRSASCPDSALDDVQSTISGWGKTSDSSNSISPVLKVASEPIMSNSVCKFYFGSYITNSHICFDGSNGNSGCNGDSGGPMTVGSGSNLEQVGIASFVSGLGCESTYPTAYTRVSCYHGWIQSKIN